MPVPFQLYNQLPISRITGHVFFGWNHLYGNGVYRASAPAESKRATILRFIRGDTMGKGLHRKPIDAIRYFVAIATLISFGLAARAGIRGPGKYCGVVIFDRWDTCFLLSGPYITYISEKVKNDLRPYAGKAMQIDASEVLQPMNPGDALIRKYKIVGTAPDTHRWAILDGLQLNVSNDFGPHGVPTFLLEIRNGGTVPVTIDPAQVAPTLLSSVDQESLFLPSDGHSLAVVTRSDLVHRGTKRVTVGGVTRSWSFTTDQKSHSVKGIEIEPHQTMKIRVTFHVPPGQYQFMFGYGGGVHEEKSLASNAIAFSLSEKGFASLAD